MIEIKIFLIVSWTMDIMNQRLSKAARLGDVFALNALLEEDPLILKRVSSCPITETPLHIAALADQIDFAKEMIRMMPSFAWELNQDGVSPVHIASASGNIEMMSELLTHSPDLCLVKDKDGRTPLHYGAIKGRVHIIEGLLSQCPQAIEELTAKGETALHLAVKYYQVKALGVLVERLEKMDNQYWELLTNAKDKEGNTILELGISSKQQQVLDLLHGKGVGVLEGYQIVSGVDSMPQASPTDMGIQNSDRSTQNKGEKMSDLPEAILVSASLIATVTYNAGLTPPPTIWKEGMKLDTRCIFQQPFKHFLSDLLGPTNTCPAVAFYMFMTANTAGFFLSIFLILLCGNGRRTRILLASPLCCMLLTYLTLIATISPNGRAFFIIYLILICFFSFLLLLLVVRKLTAKILSSVTTTQKRTQKESVPHEDP